MDVTALIGSQKTTNKTKKKTLPRTQSWISLGFEHCWKLFERMSVHNSTKYLKKVQLFSDNLTKNMLHIILLSTRLSPVSVTLCDLWQQLLYLIHSLKSSRLSDSMICCFSLDVGKKSCFGLFTDKTRQFWLQHFLTFYRLNNGVVKRG